MDNNLGFKLKRRRGLVIETLHLDEGLSGDAPKAESRPVPHVIEEEASAIADGTTVEIDDTAVRIQPSSTSAASSSGTKKLQRRTLRFDDAESGKAKAKSTHLQSGFDTKHPEKYEF